MFKRIKQYFYIKWLEKCNYDWEMVDEIIAFFNSYYKFDTHPIGRKEAFLIGGYDKSNGWLSLTLDALLWKAIAPGTNEYIRLFYRITPFEFLSNFFKSYTNTTKMWCELLEESIIKQKAKTILDYGGGSGFISMFLAKKGYEVTFAEVNQVAVEWMKYISQKKNYNIKVIDLYKEEPTEKYDFIVCKDVIEHVFDPQVLLNSLGNLSKFVMLSPHQCNGYVDREPMHFPISLRLK